jgi:hypothetical protein
MTIKQLASWIRANKQGLDWPGVHPLEDADVVLQYTRHEIFQFVHITNEHVFECCERANTFEEHISLCRPLAEADTILFNRERDKPAPKGRTKRRFR